MIKNVLVVGLLLVGCGVEDGRDGSRGAVGQTGQRGYRGLKGEQGEQGEKGEEGARGKDGKHFVYTLIAVRDSDYTPTGRQQVKISRKSYEETFDGLTPAEGCDTAPTPVQYRVKYDDIVISIAGGSYCITKSGVDQSPEEIDEFGYDNPLLLSSSKVEYEGISGSYLPKLFVYDFKEVK